MKFDTDLLIGWLILIIIYRGFNAERQTVVNLFGKDKMPESSSHKDTKPQRKVSNLIIESSL